MPGGILFDRDWEVLVESVNLALELFPDAKLNLVEACCGGGATARDLLGVFHDKDMAYYGIDALMERPHNKVKRKMECKHPKFNFIEGFTFEQKVIDQIDFPVHWLFIDGCHCEMCVKRDAKNYVPKVVQGGVVCFHDASVMGQGKYRQDYPAMKKHHDNERAFKDGIQVLPALTNMDTLGLKLFKEAYPQDKGGIRVYLKVWMK